MSLLYLFATPAFAQITPPVVDGNIDDLLNLPKDGEICALAEDSPLGDVTLTHYANFVPCTPNFKPSPMGCGFYFVDGFDISKFGAAVIGGVLYLGIRAAGQIGDSDGDGTDAQGGQCPVLGGLGQYLEDLPGIAPGEEYLWRIDTNCDGTDEYHITVQGGAGTKQPNVLILDGANIPVPGASGVAKYGTTDLEASVSGLNLPGAISVRVLARSTFSFMTEDLAGPVLCSTPRVTLALDSHSSTSTICPSQEAPIDLTVHNTSLVPLKTTLHELLPEGFGFIGVNSGDFTVCSQQGERVDFCEIEIPAGVTRVATIQVRAGAGCSGPVENRSWAEGFFQEPCLSDPASALTDTSRVALDCSGCGTSTCNVGGNGGLRVKEGGSQIMDRFRGDVSASSGSWQHVERDGGHILFQLESDQAHVILCTDGLSHAAHEAAGSARTVDFGGTGRYSSNGSTEGDACWSARVTDGGPGGEDLYALEVKDCASGTTVFSAQGPLDAGNLRIGNAKNTSAGPTGRLEPTATEVVEPAIGLMRPTPNPFASTTRIAYEVNPGPGARVELVIYSAAGRRIRSLVDGAQTAGRHETQWDGRDDGQSRVSPGVYFLCVFVNGARSATGTRILLMR